MERRCRRRCCHRSTSDWGPRGRSELGKKPKDGCFCQPPVIKKRGSGGGGETLRCYLFKGEELLEKDRGGWEALFLLQTIKLLLPELSSKEKGGRGGRAAWQYRIYSGKRRIRPDENVKDRRTHRRRKNKKADRPLPPESLQSDLPVYFPPQHNLPLSVPFQGPSVWYNAFIRRCVPARERGEGEGQK